METWNKDKVMSLSNSELLQYINYMLENGWSMGRLYEEKGIRRQTIRDRLKKYGYTYNKDLNQYTPIGVDNAAGKVENKPKEKPKAKSEQITLESINKRLEALEMRLNGIEKPTKDIKLIKFDSKQQARNYPLHQEVIDLISEISREYPHYKVKDIVNTALYIGLNNWKHSDSKE